MTEAGALPQRAGKPGQLPAGDEQLGQVVVVGRQRGERRDDPGRAVAPLRPNALRAARRLQRRRPLGKAVRALRVRRDRGDRAPLELAPPCSVQEVAVREDEHVAREPVRRAEHMRAPADDLLAPQLVVPRGPEAIGRAVPRLRPLRCSCALVHHLRGEHRPRCAPEELERRVGGVREDELQQLRLQLTGGSQRMRDEHDPGLSEHERGHDAVVRKVRLGAVPVRQARRDIAEARRELDGARPLERVQRPDDARRTEVEACRPRERRLVLLLVERVRGPQRLVRERALGVRRDGPDRGASPLGVPGRLRERLVGGRVVQVRWVARRRHGAVGARYRRRPSASGNALASSHARRRPPPRGL